MALYAFDGTWNIRDGADVIDYVQGDGGRSRSAYRDTVETNVHRIGEFYGSDDVEYVQGVGTRFGAFGRVFGGAFGFGGRYRIRRMYVALCERYFAGDRTVDIVGFSRGSAQAVHFANLLNTHGVRDPSVRHRGLWYHPDFGLTFRFPKDSNTGEKPTISVLGLFDLVGSFGVAIGPLRNASGKWKISSIPTNVERTFHAMALDEIRQTFELIRPSIDPERKAALYEVWFRGAHSNIGGGYVDRGLSDIVLVWMMEQMIYAWREKDRPVPDGFMRALHALEPGGAPDPQLHAGAMAEAMSPNPDGLIGRTRRVPRKPKWRPVEPNARVHHTTLSRSSSILSDHFNLNRPLLRPVPGDHRPSFDPPWLYTETEADQVFGFGQALFGAIPVRPSWLRISDHDDGYIYRSDDWLAQGNLQGRNDGTVRGLLRASFESVAQHWLLGGGSVDGPIDSDIDLATSHGFDNAEDAAQWCATVLEALVRVGPRTPNVEFLHQRLEQNRPAPRRYS